MPPACAIAMASRASVTVSIAAETIGRLRRIERVSRVAMSTALGITAHGRAAAARRRRRGLRE